MRRSAAHVGYLPQDIELFAETVAANISRLRTDADVGIVPAAQLARAHEMILRLPRGYETPVGEGGTFLSGGHRQRIALARAVFGDPRLVILDEPSSNLDVDGDAALNACIADLKRRGTTLVIISHRPATLALVDKLLVLRNGSVEAFGARAEVMAGLMRRECRPGGPRARALGGGGAMSGKHTPHKAKPAYGGRPSDSARGAIVVGTAIIIGFFGVLGGWAAVAPLDSAVVANALVKVEGNRKSVEHLDGGTVKALAVREGDSVKQGDVLVILDETRIRADVDVLDQQYALLRAVEARLNAERDGRDAVAIPRRSHLAPRRAFDRRRRWRGRTSSSPTAARRWPARSR